MESIFILRSHDSSEVASDIAMAKNLLVHMFTVAIVILLRRIERFRHVTHAIVQFGCTNWKLLLGSFNIWSRSFDC